MYGIIGYGTVPCQILSTENKHPQNKIFYFLLNSWVGLCLPLNFDT